MSSKTLIGATAQTFLGLTVNLRAVHDHKFDPVTHAILRMAAVFAGVKHWRPKSMQPGAVPVNGFHAASV